MHEASPVYFMKYSFGTQAFYLAFLDLFSPLKLKAMKRESMLYVNITNKSEYTGTCKLLYPISDSGHYHCYKKAGDKPLKKPFAPSKISPCLKTSLLNILLKKKKKVNNPETPVKKLFFSLLVFMFDQNS